MPNKVKRVFGRIDGMEVILSYTEGNRWEVPVPFDIDGEYVVEIIAEDYAGNYTYLTRMLYTVDVGSICVHVLPLSDFQFESQKQSFTFIAEEKTYLFEHVFHDCQEVFF